nr:hypothetical protein [Burkholderia ubonensis]
MKPLMVRRNILRVDYLMDRHVPIAAGMIASASHARRPAGAGRRAAGELRVTGLSESLEPLLHVFEQDGEWQWALTVKRTAGVGVKVVAFSREGFVREADAHAAGERARAALDGAVLA